MSRAQSAGRSEAAGQLKQLFPAAAAFSPKVPDPPHYKAFAANAGCGPADGRGLAFWTTEIEPLERGYDGPIKILVGMDTKGILTGIIVVQHHEPYGDFSIEHAGVCGAVQGEEHPRSVQSGRRHRRGVESHDHHHQRGAGHQEQRAADGHAAAGAAEMNPWGFEEDAPVETWQQIVGSQAVDLVLFAAFAALALTSFFRKSVRLKYVTLVAAVAYLGIYKSQLLSIVNVFGVLGGNLPIFKYNLGWYLFAVFAVVSTVLWGRLYCGRICAYGALTQLLDPIVPAGSATTCRCASSATRRRSNTCCSAPCCCIFSRRSDMSIYRYVEPFWMFTGRATTGLWIALGVLLVATVFVRNLYCRFLCPLGAALGLLSKLTIFGIKRWSECNSCKLCEKTCQWGAIQGPKIIMTECVRCDDCERLYMDQQKCPHWIIIGGGILRMSRQSQKQMNLFSLATGMESCGRHGWCERHRRRHGSDVEERGRDGRRCSTSRRSKGFPSMSPASRR